MKMKNNKKLTNNLWLLIFTLPALLFYIAFKLIPVAGGFFYSLTNYDGLDPAYKFVGLRNYIDILTLDTQFGNSMMVTIKFVVALVVFQNLVGLTMAMLVESRKKSKGLFRTIFYMPNMISLIVGGYMWMFIFTRVLFYIADITSLKFLDQSWIGDPKYSFIAIVCVSIWSGAGYLMIIYIAAIQSIPKSIQEAAAIDGANALQSFFYVTLPSIQYAIKICIFLTLSSSFQVFDVVYSLTGGGPGRATYVVAINIFEEAFKNNRRFGYASAKSMILFAVILAITLIQFMIMRRKEDKTYE